MSTKKSNKNDGNNPVVTDSNSGEDEPNFKKMKLGKWLNVLSEYQELDKELHPSERSVTKDYSNSVEPMMYIFTADWHLGSKSCDYKTWREDISFILGLPSSRVKMILMGDLIDNVFPSFKSAEAVFGYLRPELQKQFLETLLTQMNPFLECACWGNHDIEWDEKKIGYSDLSKMFKCTYFEAKGYLEILLGTQKYSIMLSHNLKGRSWFHSMHGNIRAWLDCRSDIVVGAHIHSPGYMRDFYGTDTQGERKERHLIQVGSYKNINDIYTDRNYQHGISELPTLVLYPDKHKIIYFSDIRDAASFLNIKSKKSSVLLG